MDKALITFSNGETLELHECQQIVGKWKVTKDNETYVAGNKIHEIWSHISNGLIPSIADSLVQFDFFHLINNENKLYSSSAVVSIENL